MPMIGNFFTIIGKRWHETKECIGGADPMTLAGARENSRRRLTDTRRFRTPLVLVDVIKHSERVPYIATRAADEHSRIATGITNLLKITSGPFFVDLTDYMNQLSTTLFPSVDGISLLNFRTA